MNGWNPETFDRWLTTDPENQPESADNFEIYQRGDRVTYMGHPATVEYGNDPVDGWPDNGLVNIVLDPPVPRMSAQMDVAASSLTRID